ncbi:MAG TPA: thioesterase family protein [Thermoanaerobaculia bacterium]|nr:thioesterase family protein [Thermoanaerobaculia bacterium]
MSEFRGSWRDGWYVVPHQVIWRDLDAFGHVNNAVFFTYFEWARSLLWWELTGVRGAREIGFIVAHASCDFRRQLSLEPIDICVRIKDMRRTSLDFHHEIRKGGGEVAATGLVTVVLYDWVSQSKMEISDELRRKVAEWTSVDAS